jgi:hypothetical protein
VQHAPGAPAGAFRTSEFEPPLGELTAGDVNLTIARRTVGSLFHTHTSTCNKNGGGQNDIDCRLKMPQEVHASTTAEPGGSGCFRLRRDYRFIVAHCPTLVLSSGINHANYVFGDTGRYHRALQIYNRAIELNLDPGPKPVLRSLEAEALDGAHYATKYSHKVDNLDLTTPALRAAATFRPPDARASGAPLDAHRHAQRRISQATNRAYGRQVFGATQCALLLDGHGDSILSHSTSPLVAFAFKNHVLSLGRTSAALQLDQAEGDSVELQRWVGCR